MALETTLPQSRRALLAAGIGGLVATVGAALGRPLGVRAVNGDPVIAGSVEDASATTGVTTSAGNGLQGISTDFGASGLYGQNDGGGYAVVGRSGGSSPTAVLGENSGSGWGVHGRSGTRGVVGEGLLGGSGVYGTSESGIGVRAHSIDGTGVQGYSGDGFPSLPAAPTKTGVYGYADQAPNARGVYGQTTIGRGVEGRATSGFGMFAQATTGRALQAGATTGTGLHAFADTNGTALIAARGHVRFSTAGLATIAAGSDSVTVTPGFDISTSSKVLAVPQGALPAGVTLAFVTRDTVNDQFTIRLSGNATVATPVAWFVIS